MAKRRTKTVSRPANKTREAARPHGESLDILPRALLVRRADSLVESCCLVAVVGLPIFFSLVTATGDEADKALLLRMLAVIASTGALTAILLEQPRKLRMSGIDPLIGAALAVFLSYCIAAILSIDPRLSFFGSQAREEGLVTHAAYLIFFLCAVTRLRSRRKIERLVTVLLVGSLPVVAYGIAQQFGIDPIPSAGGDPSIITWSVRSTFGNHVFLGAYFVLVIPVTAARLLHHWQCRSQPAVRGTGDEPLIALFAMAFVALSFVPVVAFGYHYRATSLLFLLIFAGYAVLGLLFEDLPDTAGMKKVRLWGYAVLLGLQVITLALTQARGPWIGAFVSVPVFAFLLAWKMKRPRIWWSVLGVSTAIALFVLVLNISGGPLQPLRTVHGFARLADISESGGTEGSARGRLDIWGGVGTLFEHPTSIGGSWGNGARVVVGYGPETMRLAFESVFPTNLRRLGLEIWTWDRAHDIYLDTLVDAGLLGLLALVAVMVLFFRRVFVLLRRSDDGVSWLAIGFASAMAGHLVEGIFGIETAASLLLVWLFIGCVVSFSLLEPGVSQSIEPPSRTPAFASLLVFWLVLAALAGALAVFNGIADHPSAIAFSLLLSVCAAVTVVSWWILPSQVSPARTRFLNGTWQSLRLSRGAVVGLAAVFLVAVVQLAGLFQYEVSAAADLLAPKYFNLSDPQQGLALLQQSARTSPYDPGYRTDLSRAYVFLASSRGPSADPTFRPSRGDSTMVDPSTAVLLGSDQLLALSVDALTDATNLDPLDPVGYDNLGQTYLQWHKPVLALEAFRHAERLSHKNPTYLDREALAWLQDSRISPAEADAQAAVRLDRRYWYSHYVLAQIYHHLHRIRATRVEASRALYWQKFTWPVPPASELAQLRDWKRAG